MKQSTFSAVMANNIKNLWQRYSQSLRLLLVMFLTLTASANVWGATLTGNYTKITDISKLSAGDRVVLYADDIEKGVTGWNGNKDATVAESGWVEYLVEVASDGVYLKDETANNYIASPGSSNQFKYGTKAVCTVNANGVLKCNNRFLVQNSTYYRMYSSVGSYKPFYVYKVNTATPSFDITVKSNNDAYGSVSISDKTITASPKTGYRVSTTTPYTISPASSATVSQDGNTFNVTPNANCTITINFEAIPKYTVTWNVNGDQSVTTQVTEGSKPTFPTTPSSCDATSTTFYGWATATWDGKINDTNGKTIYTSDNEMPEVNGAVTYYAVFATKGTGGGTAFDGTSGGDFKIYALVGGEKKYLKGTGSKISPVGEADATEYTFTKISDGVFSIKTGSTYLTYASSTNLGTSSSAYSWTISKGTKGSWRIASTNTSSRGIVYRASTYNQFGGYSTSNITADGTEYYDVEIGGGASVSYSGYITTCATADPCDALQAPNVTATATANSITLSWEAVDGATSYKVYNYTTDEADETTDLTYTFNGLNPETEYEWEVKSAKGECFKETQGTTTTQKACTDAVNVMKGTSSNGSFTMVSGYQSTCNGTVTVTLSNIEPATGYQFSEITQSGVDAAKVTIDNTAKTVTYAQNTSGTSTVNVTFIEIPKHTVTLNPNYPAGKKGTFTDKDGNPVSGNLVLTYNYNTASKILTDLYKTLELDGYKFNGWFSATSGGSNWKETGIITKDITLYAQWTQRHTVTWKVNGETLTPGGGNVFQTEVESGTTIYDLPNEPDAPAGCSSKVFVGWTTETIDYEDDTPPSKLYKVSSEFPVVTENVTYYAVWADETLGSGSGNYELVESQLDDYTGDYLIVYNNTNAMTTPNGTLNTNTYALYASIVSHYSNKVITSNTSTDPLAYTIAKTTNGYSIYCNKNDAYLAITNGTTSTGSRLRWNTNYSENECDWTLVTTNGTTEVKNVGSNTLSIRWNNNSGSYRFAVYAGTQQSIQLFKKIGGTTTHSAYTTICDNTKAMVTYDLNGGTDANCESQKVTKGVEFTLCNQTPTKTGYNFTGWSDGTKTYAAGATVTVDDNTTFYASWTAKNITITWDQNYTDCPEATTSNYIYDGEEIAMPTDPTRVGYKFTGWYTASTDGTQVTEVGETNKPTADVTYYAHWAELYTVTFMASGQVYVVQEDKYLSGANLELPAAPSAANYACDGYIFEGWTETEKATEDATKPTLISTPAITNDVTYYAVWKKATTSGAGETIFYESFNEYDSPGGNDGNFNTASSDKDKTVSKSDVTGWSGENVYGAKTCIKLGGSSAKGTVTTPELSQLSGSATLSFKAAAWANNKEQTDLVLSITGGGTLDKTSVTMIKGAWQTYELTITGGTSNTKITFEGSQNSNSRFFLDEVKVATSGSYNYTTSPSCGPTIVAKEGMWVTSSNAQSVKVNVPIAVKSFANNATITGTCANENFVVTQLDNVGNGEHNVVVTYTPNAFDTKEDATITLTAKNGDETLTTTTFTLNGHSLPETFAVVVDKASTYYALPANMPEAGVYPGFNVSLNGDKSAVVAAPKTHLYALKAVHKDRFDENGTCVRLEGNNTACLWATNAANGTHIRNWAQLNNADGAQYEWSLYTEDGDTYSISCAAVTENGRILRMYGDNFGMYKSGASVFRLLLVECTEQPTNVLVSAARVAATIAWTNVASCDVKVYLKSNASLVKTISGVASPVTVTELAETTEYTYTITPVGNVACEVSGAFKTTGPDIDIVEWMTDGIIIQVDKDESVNPKVVIKGEVEHNTGSGVMATELFFSKYFEAHGHNKLLAIYNGTGAPIDLSGYEIRSENGTLDLSQFGQTKGTVAPNEEIILVYYDATDNNNDNIPDYSAEPCAEEQEGYEKWNILTEQSVLAFSGRGSIGLYKDDVLIDVIGSTFPSGELTKIGKSGKPDYCGDEEDVRLHIDGVSVNDQSSFFCTNGDNIKTNEVETNYAISTNRCLLIRKNTVTSGEDAVTTNKAEAGATCGDLSSTFKTLCSEWAGFRIGSGNSNDDEVKEATCDGLGYVGGFDYNKYYREFQTLDDSQTLDKFEYNLEENLYKLTIDNVAQYSCLNIQVQINDPVNGTVLTEQTAQVPILVTAANTTTDGLFSNIIDGDLDASRTRCSTCDVVVLDGATLRKAAAETANDVNQVRNVYVYPGGQLIVPETGNDYKVNSVSFRRVEDAVANAQLNSNLNITASSEKPVYVDVRVNAENWHWFTLPYDCNIADVTWVDGTPAKYGVDWFLSTYDGEKRAATQSGGCWADFHGETIKAGVGYIVGIAGHPTKSKVKYELRFPMSKEVLAQEVAGTDKTVPVYAWGVDEDMRPTHKGWNLVGNPYLDFYKKYNLNSFGGLRLGGKYVLNQSTGYYEDSHEWDGQPDGNLPYVVVPINGGWSAYDQVLVSSIDLLPFTAYFVQVGNPETENNGDLKDVLFDGDNRGRASIARRAPSSVNEADEPIIVGVNLTNAKGESDKTSLVIDDKYTDEYEMNADFFKWFGDYYRYYTKPVLYTIGDDKQQRAFNAINVEQAAKPISMGTYTAQNGEYTFSLDRRSDLTRVKEVWLHDATESAYVNLMQEDYSFSTGKTDGTGRFTLAVTLHPKSPTDITEGRDGHSYVTSHQRTLYVNNLPQQARVWVYDAVGKLLVNETTNVYQRAYHLGQAGVYFVRVQSQNGCETLQAVVE